MDGSRPIFMSELKADDAYDMCICIFICLFTSVYTYIHVCIHAGGGSFLVLFLFFFSVFFLVLGLRRKQGGQEERKEGRDRFFVHICAGNAGSNATLC